MNLFELLFVVLFLLVPLFEGIMKKKRQNQEPPLPEEPKPDHEADRPAAARQPVDDGPASEMLPDDLWAVLTGEQRERAPVEVADREVPAREEDGAPWSDRPAWGTDSRSDAEPEPGEVGWHEIGEEEAAVREPVSLEYEGPEAYTLETPPPPPEARHAAFHRRLTETAEPRKPVVRRSRNLVRELQTRGGLRQGILLSEILAPPKGLE